MKPVPATLREKKRYIAFKALTEGHLAKGQVIGAILDETLRFFGESRASEFALYVMEFNEKSKTGYLICNHRYKGEIIACLALIHSVAQQRVCFQVLGVSGTIESLKRKFLKGNTDMSQH